MTRCAPIAPMSPSPPRKRRFEPVSLFVLVTALGASAPAAAQLADAVPTSAGPKAARKADALLQEALRLIAQEKWADAEQKLLAAWALHKTFDIAANLGQTQARLGKHRQAAQNLAFALRNWPVMGDMVAKRAHAQKRLNEVRPFIASVTVKVNVAGAEVLVDGAPVGTSPLKDEIFLDPGAHTIEATLAGHGSEVQKLDAAKGSTMTVSFTLKPAAPSAGSAAATEPRAAQGDVKPPEVNQPDAKTPPVTAQPGAPGSTPEGSKLPVRTILIGTGVGTSAVLIGTGIGFAVASSSKGSEADTLLTSLEKANGPAPCPAGNNIAECDNLFELRGSQSTYRNVAFWTFIAGGITGAGTLVYALVKPKQPATTTVQAVPVAGAGHVGLVVRGQW